MAFIPDPQPTSGGFVPDARTPGPTTRGRVNTPARQAYRADLEAQLVQDNAAADEAQRNLDAIAPFEEPVRQIARPLTALARGNPLVSIPAMVEAPIAAGYEAITGDKAMRPFGDAYSALRPPELAPRNDAEHYADTGAEFMGGVVGGLGAGEILVKSGGDVARRVGQTLLDTPDLQALSALTGATGVETVRREGGGPVAQTLAGLAAGAAPFAAGGMHAPGAPPAPIRNPRPFGDPVASARRIGLSLEPAAVEAQAQLASPEGVMPSVPGTRRAAFAGPELPVKQTIENAKKIDAYAAQEIGLPPGTPLDDASLAMAKGPQNAVYNELEQRVPLMEKDMQLALAVDDLGAAQRNNQLLDTSPEVERLRSRLMDADPMVPTGDVLAAIRTFRSRARTLFRSVDDPGKLEMAHAYRAAASALEDNLLRAAQQSGDAGLVARMQEARTTLAKIHNVEDASYGGHLDPQILAKIAEKSPLTGYLADIASAAVHFPGTVRSPVGVAIPTPSMTGMIASAGYYARRRLGEGLIPGMVSERFQGKYGEFDPNYNPMDTRPDFPSPAPPMGPPAPPPPPDGRYPWSPAGEGPLSLADEIGGGVPFSETQLPPTGGEGVALADQVAPDFFGASNIPDTGGLSLADNPLGEMLGSGVGVERYPFTPTQTDAPGLQPGASVGMSDPLMPEPGPFGPDPMPTPRGPNDAPPFGRGPKVGGRGPGPDNLGFAPDNAHELPNLGDLIAGLRQGAPESPYGKLPPELQALADVLTGAAPEGGSGGLGDLFAALGTEPGPAAPMAPPKGSRGLGDVFSGLDATAEPTGQAAPADFGDLIPPEALGLTPPAPKAPRAPKAATPAKLRVEDSVPANAIKDRHLPPNSLLISQGPKGNPSRWIALERINGRLRTRSINAERYKAENPDAKGAGKELYLEAARQAQQRQLPWDSDSSIDESAFHALDSLFSSGQLQAKGWDKVRQQLLDIYATGDKKAKNPAGDKPWIEDIRLGSTE